MRNNQQMSQRGIIARFDEGTAHLKYAAGGAAKRVRGHLRENRNRGAGQNMSCTQAGRGWRAKDSRVVRSRGGILRARFDDVENGPGAAALAGSDDVEINVCHRFVFKQQFSQIDVINEQYRFVEPRWLTELDIRNGVNGEGELHYSSQMTVNCMNEL